MTTVDAVTAATRFESDYWMLYLPDAEKKAYFRSVVKDQRDEFMEFITMKSAGTVLKEEGIRGLCFL